VGLAAAVVLAKASARCDDFQTRAFAECERSPDPVFDRTKLLLHLRASSHATVQQLE
jgi:hypothetical protein